MIEMHSKRNFSLPQPITVELKTKWLKALRSGHYKQGRGQLCTSPKPGKFRYCCLGVLAQIDGKLKSTTLGGWRKEKAFQGHNLSWLFDKKGVKGESRYLHRNFQYKLGEMNDEAGINNNFKKIAAWIEVNVVPI